MSFRFRRATLRREIVTGTRSRTPGKPWAGGFARTGQNGNRLGFAANETTVPNAEEPRPPARHTLLDMGLGLEVNAGDYPVRMMARSAKSEHRGGQKEPSVTRALAATARWKTNSGDRSGAAHDFGRIRVHDAPRGEKQGGRSGGRTRCPSLTIPLRPVFFRSTPRGPATGVTWAARLAAANQIWGHCGVAFTAARPRTVVDPTHTTAGDDQPALRAFEARHHVAGRSSEVFLIDNDITWAGGGATHGRAHTGWINLSDRGGNVNLLAHELGHLMGFDDWIHSAPYARGTVMESTNSNQTPNPSHVTSVICMMLTHPSRPDSACFRT